MAIKPTYTIFICSFAPFKGADFSRSSGRSFGREAVTLGLFAIRGAVWYTFRNFTVTFCYSGKKARAHG